MSRERVVPTTLSKVLGTVLLVAFAIVMLLALAALATVLWGVIVS